MRPVLRIVVTLAAVLWSSHALAEEAYYEVPLGSLKITEGKLPRPGEANDHAFAWRVDAMQPYAVLDGEGEVYLTIPSNASMRWETFRRTGQTESIHVRTAARRGVSGHLFYPKADFSAMLALKFTIPAAEANAKARIPFYEAKQRHFESLLGRDIPGGAWFRHQAREAEASLDAKHRDALTAAQRRNWRSGNSLDDTYALFSGGRAVSENLQLDRALPQAGKNSSPVKVDSLAGISLAEIDWGPMVKDVKPELDPLAAAVPADQHAVFFPTFAAAVATADEADRQGTPLLQFAEPRSEDARVSKRYQRQLGLSLTGLGRLLGPHVVRSVALTGSDPYFRVGTDVAVLFEPANAAVLEQLLLAQVAMAGSANSLAKPVSGAVDGLVYHGLCSPDRSISSYVARLHGAVVVSNSLYQLERLARVGKGKSRSIAALPEYAFFRDRYRRGDAAETALLFLSDATIRRWCSPRWRIGDSRRTRMAAVLAELQASQVNRLATNHAEPGPIYSDLALPGGGELTLSRSGVASAVYGSLEFMTPIGELPLDEVTQEEADAYNRWREGYQRNWRWAFDPMALRLTFAAGQLAADLTVMPLILGSEYREMQAVSRGAKIAAGAGDPHQALAHLVLAINPHSRMFQQWGNIVSSMRQGLTLGWLGSSVAVYVDYDPFWLEVGKVAGDQGKLAQLIENNVSRLPIAIRADVSDGLKLTLFLASARAFIEQTAPEMLHWESLKHNDQPYVKVTPSDSARRGIGNPANFSLYYAASGESLMITPNEPLLKRALDRQALRHKLVEQGKKSAAEARPWLGSSFAAQIDRNGMAMLEALSHDEYRRAMQLLAWGNLPILNEWKHRWPGQDPVDLQERLFKTRLICPGGGKYVWNEKWQTMESTVYGHPGEPKPGPAAPPALESLNSASFGLDFEEHDGLRARVRLDRSPDRQQHSN